MSRGQAFYLSQLSCGDLGVSKCKIRVFFKNLACRLEGDWSCRCAIATMGLLDETDGEAAAEPPISPVEAVRAERSVLLEFVVLPAKAA